MFQRVVHEVEGDGFLLQPDCYIPMQPMIDLQLTLQCDAHGKVRLQAHAMPRGDLLTNRTGLCLLHPMHATGWTLQVEHVDGRISRSTFVEQVPPWTPFSGVRGIRHEFAPGHWAQVRFTGDDFEFEDQRNNADDSFKTYSRSNTLPRPYVLRGGAAIEQSLTLRIEPAAVPLDSAHLKARVVNLHAYAEVARMPQLGLAIEPADAQASPLV